MIKDRSLGRREALYISSVPPDFACNLRIFEAMFVGEAFSDRLEELYESMGNSRERWRLC